MAAAREVVEAPTFTGGYLKVTTLKEGQPFDAHADVIRQSDNKGMGGKNTWYRGKPAEYMLVPGIYYISVYDRKTKERKEIRDVELCRVRRSKKTVVFCWVTIFADVLKREMELKNEHTPRNHRRLRQKKILSDQSLNDRIIRAQGRIQ